MEQVSSAYGLEDRIVVVMFPPVLNFCWVFQNVQKFCIYSRMELVK